MQEKINEIFKENFGTNVLDVKRLNGCSNVVFRVEDSKGNKYVFKFHGEEKENPFKLLEKHVLKSVEYEFVYEKGDISIEKFIEGESIPYRELKKKEFYTLSMLHPIANMNKKKFVESRYPNLFYIFECSQNLIFEKISLKINSIKNNLLRERIIDQFERINKVFFFYEKSLKQEKMVLSHNDLVYTNLIYKMPQKEFILIDFEYSGYNPMGMDIFNIINEDLIDYNCDDCPNRRVLFENYPKDDTIKELIHFYLYFLEFGHTLLNYQHDSKFIESIREDPRFQNIKESEILKLFNRFPYFGVITNIYWYYWSLYWFENKDINFNYLKFSECKFDCVEFFLKLEGNQDLLN